MLYEDLLTLSVGETCSGEGVAKEDYPQSDEESLDLQDIKQEASQQMMTEEGPATRNVAQPQANSQNIQTDLLLNSLKTTVIKGNYENSVDYSFFQQIITMIDTYNSLLKETIASQDKISSKIQECKKFTKSAE